MIRYALLVLVFSLTLLGAGTAHAGKLLLTVDNVGDAPDDNPGDFICAIAGGGCTLRAAIMESNATAGAAIIEFDLPDPDAAITPATPLPAIIDTVSIDGTTQAGCASYPCIVVTGVTVGGDGLTVQTDESEIRGLVIQSFNVGVLISDGADGNTIAGNYVGTDVAGTKNFGNYNGISLEGGVDNVIGGPDAADRNVVAGYTGRGISLEGEFVSQSVITNNYIGVLADGETALGGGVGVFVRDEPTSGRARVGASGGGEDNIVGPGNVISGNIGAGVHVWSSGTVVIGNRIGTNASGTSAVPNMEDGVLVHGSGNRIGGDSAAERNLISGNGQGGVQINPYDLSPAEGTTVTGNYIGTNAAGNAAIPNAFGIGVSGASFTTIGGVGGERNVLSGNVFLGIGASEVTGLQIVGNYIGTNASGTSAVPNTLHGMSLSGMLSETQVIGNLVSGNSSLGIDLNSGTNGVELFANRIGVDASGDPLGNGSHGMSLSSVVNTVIGAEGEKDPFGDFGNTIANNGGNGVWVRGNDGPGTGNTIRFNSIHSNALKGIENELNGNNELAPPVITPPLSAGLSSGVSGTACASCTVDIYSDDADEGRTYEASVVAEGDGSWASDVIAAGPFITATATDGAGNTSEFSLPVDAPKVPTPTPTPEPTATPAPTSTPVPTTTPGPTATPGPSETPGPKGTQGDTDCDDDVDSVDSLFVLRDVAGFEPSKCIENGDVDCDDDRDSVDGLGILRHVAALPPLVQQEPCADIGTPL